MSGEISPIRFRDGAWEYRCPLCREWLELTAENWRPKHGMTRCGACWAGYFAARERGYRSNAAVVEAIRESRRIKYAANREAHLASQRAWKAKNKEHCRAYMRVWRARQREQVAA